MYCKLHLISPGLTHLRKKFYEGFLNGDGEGGKGGRGEGGKGGKGGKWWREGERSYNQWCF